MINKQRTIDNFIVFLTEEDILDEFKEKLKTASRGTIKEFCELVKPKNYIIGAFCWQGEPKEIFLWQSINTAWCKLLSDDMEYGN